MRYNRAASITRAALFPTEGIMKRRDFLLAGSAAVAGPLLFPGWSLAQSVVALPAAGADGC